MRQSDYAGIIDNRVASIVNRKLSIRRFNRYSAHAKKHGLQSMFDGYLQQAAHCIAASQTVYWQADYGKQLFIAANLLTQAAYCTRQAIRVQYYMTTKEGKA